MTQLYETGSSMKIIISASARFGGSNYLAPWLRWRRGAMRLRAPCARAHGRVPPPSSGPGRLRRAIDGESRGPRRVFGAPRRLVGAGAPGCPETWGSVRPLEKTGSPGSRCLPAFGEKPSGRRRPR